MQSELDYLHFDFGEGCEKRRQHHQSGEKKSCKIHRNDAPKIERQSQ